ncbi:MAG: hypothetical protein EPN79_11200 [Burkholderiaceae bacterium]|nr:MAG: hypothetical protein EPN79_11200 [Burkholderiaceae bacterium]TBR76749.1 MAG: hypothetical protein EPN64_05875 [Burkholderiaceae bacterium]
MPTYRNEAFGWIHMKGTNLPAPCGAQIWIDGKSVACAYPSEFQCDGPPPPERQGDYNDTGTCDRSLCERHAAQVGRNRHLCPSCHTARFESSGQRSLFTQLVSSPHE